jgi:predicted Ser/Thr protein kinase
VSIEETHPVSPPITVPLDWIGDYRVESKLGEGAMGVVYRVMHREGRGPFALKLLKAETLDDSRSVKRFANEARSMCALGEHPNIVGVVDTGVSDEGPFVVLDFVEGENLRVLLKEGDLTEGSVIDFVVNVVDALAFAHDRGFVHRDVKPENVLITPDARALLTDFGVARVLGDLDKLTQTGELLGTPVYMAPEQVATDLGPVGPAADVYAVGVMLYQLVCGRSPYESTSTVGLLTHLMNGDSFPPPRELRPRIDPAWEDVITGALQRDPRERYVNAAELAVALQAVSDKPIEGGHRGAGSLLAGALVAILVLAAAIGIGLSAQGEGRAARNQPSPVASKPPLSVEESALAEAWAKQDLAGVEALCKSAPQSEASQRYLEWVRHWRALEAHRTAGESKELSSLARQLIETNEDARLADQARGYLAHYLLFTRRRPAEALRALGKARPRLDWLGLILSFEEGPAKEALSHWPKTYLPASRARLAAWDGNSAKCSESLAQISNSAHAMALHWSFWTCLGLPEGPLRLSPEETSSPWSAIAQAERGIATGAYWLADRRLGFGAPGKKWSVSEQVAWYLLKSQRAYLRSDQAGALKAWGLAWEKAERLVDDPLLVSAVAAFGLRTLRLDTGAPLGAWAAPCPAPPFQDTVHGQLDVARSGLGGVEGRVLADAWELVDASCAGGVYRKSEVEWTQALFGRFKKDSNYALAARVASLRLDLLKGALVEGSNLELSNRLGNADACGKGWGSLLKGRIYLARGRLRTLPAWRAHHATGKGLEASGFAEDWDAALRFLLTAKVEFLEQGAPKAEQTRAALELAAARLERAQLEWLQKGGLKGRMGSEKLGDDLESDLGLLLDLEAASALQKAARAWLDAESPGEELLLNLASAAVVAPATLQAWWIRAGVGDKRAQRLNQALEFAQRLVPALAVARVRRAEMQPGEDSLEAWPDLPLPLLQYRRVSAAKATTLEGWVVLAQALERAPDLLPLVKARARALSDEAVGLITEAARATEDAETRLAGALVTALKGYDTTELAGLRWRLPGHVLPDLVAADALTKDKRYALARDHARRVSLRVPDSHAVAHIRLSIESSVTVSDETPKQSALRIYRYSDEAHALGLDDRRRKGGTERALAAWEVLGGQRPRGEDNFVRHARWTAIGAWRAFNLDPLLPARPSPRRRMEELLGSRISSSSGSMRALLVSAEDAGSRQPQRALESALRTLCGAREGGVGPRLLRPGHRLRFLLPRARAGETTFKGVLLPNNRRLWAATAGALRADAAALGLVAQFGRGGAWPFHPHSRVRARLAAADAPGPLPIGVNERRPGLDLLAAMWLTPDDRQPGFRLWSLVQFGYRNVWPRGKPLADLIWAVEQIGAGCSPSDPRPKFALLDLLVDQAGFDAARLPALRPRIAALLPAAIDPKLSVNHRFEVFWQQARRELCLTGKISDSKRALYKGICAEMGRVPTNAWLEHDPWHARLIEALK